MLKARDKLASFRPELLTSAVRRREESGIPLKLGSFRQKKLKVDFSHGCTRMTRMEKQNTYPCAPVFIRG